MENDHAREYEESPPHPVDWFMGTESSVVLIKEWIFRFFIETADGIVFLRNFEARACEGVDLRWRFIEGRTEDDHLLFFVKAGISTRA